MSRSTRSCNSATEGDDSEDTPVLLYDANCTMCNELAYKVRDRATKPLRLVALSDPEADDILSTNYSESWSEDFYFVSGGSVRKGKRALPSIMKTVGVSDFTGLVGDYLRHQRNQDGDCAHDGATESDAFSRRRFVGAAAAVGTALFANPASAQEYNGRPPAGLTARVARVRPDGGGGFTASIEQTDDLIRQETWNADSTPSADGGESASMESVRTDTLLDRGSLQVQREDLDLRAASDDEIIERALEGERSGRTDTARMTRYGVLDDRDRFGLSLNFAEGPMKVDGAATIDSTLSGRISHDVARKTVDFIKFESENAADIESHLAGYVAGLNAFERHYAERDDRKMAALYREIADNLAESTAVISDAVDEDFEPVRNVLSISSVPNWTEYVESPTTEGSAYYQTSDVSGTDCDCSCCTLGCCTGCDCGCGVCIGTPKPGCGCSCCVGGCGGGCGCGCCYCVVD